MVINKSSVIRSPHIGSWPIRYPVRPDLVDFPDLYAHYSSLLNKFFSSSFIIRQGIGFSHNLLCFGIYRSTIYSYIYDSQLSDFISTSLYFFPFSVSRLPRYSHVRFRGMRRDFAPFRRFYNRKLYYYRPFYYRISRSRFFNSRAAVSRFRYFRFRRRGFRFKLMRRRRYLYRRIHHRERLAFFTRFIFIRRFQRNLHIRRWIFISRFIAKYLYRQIGNQPIKVSTIYLHPKRFTPQFLLNFICTRLYYRYILRDVVAPIARRSLSSYSGFVITCSGRFTRAQIARSITMRRGKICFSSVSTPLEYHQKFVVLRYGTCNIRIWLRYRRYSTFLCLALNLPFRRAKKLTIINCGQRVLFLLFCIIVITHLSRICQSILVIPGFLNIQILSDFD